ncbi:hypothetical protein [Lactovum odontotermitis]
MAGKTANDLPKAGVKMAFSNPESKTASASGKVSTKAEEGQKILRDSLDKTPKAEYLPGKTPEAILKGRPDPTDPTKIIHDLPETYLDPDYIIAHNKQFENGVTKFQSESQRLSDIANYGDSLGSPKGQFVFPKDYADEMINASGGSPRELERLLGLKQGELGDNPLRFDIDKADNIRIPSGNEPGSAQNELWRPGGYTYPGGVPEAVIDQVQPGKFNSSHVFGGE